MLSVYAIRYLVCFIVSFLLLIIYFSIKKPPYIVDEKYKIDKIDNISNISNIVSIKLLLVYSVLYSSIISLVFMVIGIIYQYYLSILFLK